MAYERGDPVDYTSAGFIEIDGLAFHRGQRERAARFPPLVDLSAAVLGEIDERETTGAPVPVPARGGEAPGPHPPVA